ncbi:hypothetical protein IC235_12120 [Hymenobacter sp. BT664]|uniref:Tetratricopeptide repeat protein n=1 Tax=Hymenobacter montanus TaxID=2771359 RepID=A0A927BED8_9BACT|nr:hypothetical protein [Hymenobacter montanus]MBD2768634.1 hypothetical protein [Hymenobacter montanus]
MKTMLFALALGAASFSAAAQATALASAARPAAAASTGYADLMAATITELLGTGDPAQLKQLASKFERAGTVAPADWLPPYYQSYALMLTAFQSKEDGDVKDKYLDQAEAALARASKQGGDASELLVLQAYIYQARLSVSPMMRSMKYPSMVTQTLEEAKKHNPNNPRIYLVQANNLYYTPKMFGGGADAAKPYYEQAKAKFAVAKPANSLVPSWGERQVLGRLKQYDPTAAK